jgi:uncharacterized protein YbjT (DUF2867 family)
MLRSISAAQLMALRRQTELQENVMPRAFIPAITGAQSTEIAASLRSAGWAVDGSSRSEPGDARIRVANVDALIITIPQDHRPGAMNAFVDYWVEAGIAGSAGRIILNVGGTPGPATASPFFADLHAAQGRVMGSGLPYVILQPTVYLDNLAAPWAAEALAAGTIDYPAVAEAEVSWMSHRTLGAWVSVVAAGAADGRVLAIGGPVAVTGDQLAVEVGSVLGRTVRYAPLPPADFARGMNAALGVPAGDRLASIYSWLADHPGAMRVHPAEAQQFGVTLESVADFTARVLK